MTTKYVYAFAEGNRDLKDLLGGKGANLAEMTRIGLPDRFIECGSVPTLQARYGISLDAMIERIGSLVKFAA